MSESKWIGCSWFTALSLGILAVGMSACSGDDGTRGPPGPQGPEGPPGETVVVSGDATSLDIVIGAASVSDGTPAVDFTVTDEDGIPFIGLPEDVLEFTIAKLVPGLEGDSSRWQSYINGVEQPGVGPGTEQKIQAATDDGGTLADHGNGTYTYTFGTDITNVTDPLAVAYEPHLTHRVGMGIRSNELPTPHNAIFDFQPSSGATMSIPSREIVQTASCNECHGELDAHGGPRNDTRYCVTCHNPGTADANSGNTVDFKVMIHKIHFGEELPSGEYTIYGFRDTPHDFSDVAFPQDIRNCTKCHDPADNETPDAVNFTEVPTLAACGSCHEDVNFATGENHPGGVVEDNSECTVCHAEQRVAGSIAEDHRIPSQLAAQQFAYNILDVSNTAPGQTPTVTFSITDPTNADAPYDVLNDPEFDPANGASVNLDLAWPTTDYTNFDPDTGAVTGNAPARPASMSLLDASNVVDNGDGTFTLTSTLAIPSTLQGSGAVAIEGHPAADIDGDGNFVSAPVTGAVEFFAVTDSEPVPRREVVDVARCQNCHGTNDGLALHGGNRTDNVQLCVLCHNPNNTDLAVRFADPDGMEDGVNTAAPDGLEERSIDFKQLIHSIHAADHRSTDYVVFGFRNSVHDFSHVGFPAAVQNCGTCHLEDTYTVPLADNVLATTVDTQATVNTSSPFGTSDFIPGDGSAAEPTDDGNVTATAAVCSSCHDTTLALEHMKQNGAGFSLEAPGSVDSGFDVLQADVDNGTVIETCAVCHGSGRIADVAVVHGLAD